MGSSGNNGPAPWVDSFEVETGGTVQPDGLIVLSQTASKTFILGSTVRYIGQKTGLENKGLTPTEMDDVKIVRPSDLRPTTDLASVPGPLRWFVNSYGRHTPAALIHDRLIPTDSESHPGMKDAYADRFFRFMLEDLGYPWIKRWLMWAAVAFRTFYKTRRWTSILWVAISLAAMTAFVVAIATSNWIWAFLLAVLPLPVSFLWREQYGAGIVAAAAAPFVLPPAVVVAVAYAVYWALEQAGRLLFPSRS